MFAFGKYRQPPLPASTGLSIISPEVADAVAARIDNVSEKQYLGS
jgi:hypothetical protein